MTNQEIETRMESLVKTERKITREILTLINLIDERKIHLSEGYGSMFNYLTSRHGYSESAAQRRIQSARLLKATPEIASKVSSGELTLSTMAKVQSSIRIQEKASGEKLTVERKMQIIEKVEGKTFAETEKTLMQELSELVLSVHQEKRTKVDDTTTRVSANISDKALADIERIKELFAHQLHGASLSEVIEFMAERIIKTKVVSPAGVDESKIKPLTSTKSGYVNSENTVSAKQRVTLNTVTPRLRRDIFGRAQYQCEYINPITKLRCTRRYQLEVDHIQPKAMGGDNREENLRCLCRNHNLYMGWKNLGEQKMNRWKQS